MRFLLIFLIPFSIFSQTNHQTSKFDSIFYHVAVNVSSADPVKALYLADSLSLYAANKKQKTKALMLIADIYEKQEKRGKAIIEALKVLEIAKEEKDYEYQARMYGFLSTQYRKIGFKDKGKKLINEGIKIIKHISNKKKATSCLALFKQELAEYAIEDKEYKKAIEHLKLAVFKFEKEENLQVKSFILSNTEESLARCYMSLEENDKALTHLYKAKYHLNKAGAENTIWASSIYQALGSIFLDSKKIDSAGIYLKRAHSISKESKHATLKKFVFKSLSDYYKERNEIDSFKVYNSKYNKITNKIEEQKKLMVNSAYNSLNEQPNKKSVYPYLIFALILILLVFVIVFVRKKISKKSKIKHNNHKGNSTVYTISEKAESELILKLKEFEKSNKFLDKNMSLPKLITLLNTNGKYLGSFLKNTKNTDYVTYINQLRVNYIKEKLISDKEYLNYKIKYLAKESGFSSHSKFSACFKKATGLSPSDFIAKLKNKSN